MFKPIKLKVHKVKSKSQNNNGFVLLFAVLITGVILSAALGVSRIVNKEIIIASIGKDSQLAFFAADSGAECALYWNDQGRFDRTVPAPSPIFCNGWVLSHDEENIIVANNKDVIGSEVPELGEVTTNILGGQDVSVFGFGTSGDLTQPCSIVIVDKRTESGAVVTKIISKGYNTCTETRRRVERALEVTVAG